ncbi:MAG: Crp/Fnr family transcriptional regulator [Clostridia bacterium]|nr:Crp/Fnr family transcriptional regulator [Clostridia bacterium]
MLYDFLADKFDFIRKMKPDEFEYLKKNILYKEIKKDEMIFGAHDRCESIPLVIRGQLRLFRVSDEGREMTSYYIMPGNICILAAVCTIGMMEYDFTAQAVEDTLMAMLDPESFRHLLNTSSSFKNFVFIEMADKLITSISLIDDMKFTKIEDRIMEYLHRNADEDGLLSITHENLAVNIGTVREVVSRQLKKMEKSGKIIMGRKEIRLLDS